VLSGYNFLFRIAFDLFNTLFLLRLILRNRKIVDAAVIPKVMIGFFILHLSWFIISLFNPTGVTPIYALATVKYYILPIVLFFSMLTIEALSDLRYLRRLGMIVLIFTLVNTSLCIYQMYIGDQSVNQMSSNYTTLFKKYEFFQGKFFRPWGTSHEVGGTSVILTCTLGFLFLYVRKNHRIWKGVIFFAAIGLSWATLFICQHRSQFIKHSLILSGIIFVLYFIANRSRIKALVTGFVLLMSLPVFLLFVPDLAFVEQDARLETASKRYSNLLETGISQKRPSLSNVIDRITNHANLPFGYGPGMVSNFIPQIGQRRKELIGVEEHYLWSGDNLLMFTVLELGIGALFYLPLFLIAPVVILRRVIRMDREKQADQFQVGLICFVVLCVLILGNWGYVGLPFNPESFFFWIWTVIGWKVTQKSGLNEEILAK